MGKLATEIVMAEPGSDNGMLPILDFVSKLRDESAGHPEAANFHLAAKDMADGMMAIVEALRLFTAEDLDYLGKTLAQLNELAAKPDAPYVPIKQGGTPAAPQIKPADGDKTPPADAEGEPALLLNLESDAELLREFINESQEHLDNIEQGVLVLEDNPADADTLNSIFRAFHTFKGGAGFLNLVPIKELAHQLESLLDMARQHKLEITSPIIELILQGGDTLKRFIGEIEPQVSGKKPVEAIVIPTSVLKNKVKAVIEGGPVAAENAVQPVQKGEPAPAAAKEEGAVTKTVVKQSGGAVVKVDTQKLDAVVDMVGELVIAESLVMQDPSIRNLESRQLLRNLAQLRRITNELQRVAMSMRMVPVRATFQKMTRIVRDLAVKLGKEAQLTMSGEDTELDRTIVEEISDPLMHMIRNAVDHGIEMPDARKQAGKSGQGTIHLQAFHEGGNIVIQIKDDGAGLNKERIRARAVEKGLVSSEETLTDQEIYLQIFAPGFSTATVVTDVSGRGVGMDVVRRNIEKLRGKVEIESELGKGSTFSIYLPLTLAIIEGLIVKVGEERYIIPTLTIRESFRPTAGMISTVHERGEMVNVRGRLIPLLRLHEFFGVTPKTTEATDSIVVVVESGRECRCVLVDQLVGKQEVVIKSLGETFKANRALAGAAILGDGRVGLILDSSTLVKLKADKHLTV